MLARAVRMSGVADGGEQLQKEREVAIFENSLFGAHAKDNLLFTAERYGFGAHAGAGKFQAPPAKGKLCRGEDGDLAVGQDGIDAGNRFGKPFARGGFVGGVYQARGHVAAVGAVDFHQGVMALVQFKQTPFGGRPVQVGHAFANQRGTSVGHK